ncbi:MAG: metal ABC transporter permease [Candidatus Methanomethylophilaceae archaeon]|jgi:zinc transport system permease protein
MTSILDYLSISLVQNMFMATVCACILCGVIGTYVVVNRMVASTGGIAHTTFGGVGFAYYVMSVFMVGWMTPMLGAVIFAVVAAVIMVVCKRISDLRQDTMIGVLWAVGMAIGVIFMCFMDRTVVVPASFETILFGNVLLVSRSTLLTMAVVTAVILIIVAFMYREFQILTFDQVHARISGMNVTLVDLVLYILVALSCVMVANVVGIIMIIALMTIPAAMANLFTHNMKSMMLLGTVLSVILSVLGLFLCLAWDSPPGATVVLAVGIAFVAALIIKRLSKAESAKADS